MTSCVTLMRKVFELRKKYGGLLSRLDFGDKGCNMLILWGAPVAYENDIGRALNFLLDLRSQVDIPDHCRCDVLHCPCRLSGQRHV